MNQPVTPPPPADDATILRQNFAKFLAPSYLGDPVFFARLCDEDLDRSGALLGYVREEAEKLRNAGGAL